MLGIREKLGKGGRKKITISRKKKSKAREGREIKRQEGQIVDCRREGVKV